MNKVHALHFRFPMPLTLEREIHLCRDQFLAESPINAYGAVHLLTYTLALESKICDIYET